MFFPPSGNFSSIKEVFYKQIFFLNQGSFQQTNIFPSWMFSTNIFSSSRKFPERKKSFLLSRKFSSIKEVFHKQIFFLNQGSFQQTSIFPSSLMFSTDIFPLSSKCSTNKYFSFTKEVFHKQIFSFIKEVFHKQIFFMIMKVFLKVSLKILRKNILTHFTTLLKSFLWCKFLNGYRFKIYKKIENMSMQTSKSKFW